MRRARFPAAFSAVRMRARAGRLGVLLRTRRACDGLRQRGWFRRLGAPASAPTPDAARMPARRACFRLPLVLGGLVGMYLPPRQLSNSLPSGSSALPLSIRRTPAVASQPARGRLLKSAALMRLFSILAAGCWRFAAMPCTSAMGLPSQRPMSPSRLNVLSSTL